MEGGLDIVQILLESGFVVKFVLVLLIICSIISWAIIIEKRNIFAKVNDANEGFQNYFNNHTDLKKINSAALEENDSTMAIMYRSGFQELLNIEDKLSASGKDDGFRLYFHNHGQEALERSLKCGANQGTMAMEKRLSTLASIGSVAPFIGLLGTVWGIIDSFAGLASGGGSIEAIAPGIAEALVATAAGLAAAIPAVWAYNIFITKIANTHIEMDSFAQDFLNLVDREVLIGKDE